MAATKQTQNVGKPPVKRNPKVLANPTGEAYQLPEELVGLFGPVHRSAYDTQLDALIADTRAERDRPGGHPERIARRFADMKAKSSLKKRAAEKKIVLEFLDLPAEKGGGFAIRISPAQSKPTEAAAGAAQPAHQGGPQ